MSPPTDDLRKGEGKLRVEEGKSSNMSVVPGEQETSDPSFTSETKMMQKCIQIQMYSDPHYYFFICKTKNSQKHSRGLWVMTYSWLQLSYRTKDKGNVEH